MIWSKGWKTLNGIVKPVGSVHPLGGAVMRDGSSFDITDHPIEWDNINSHAFK